MRTVTSVFIGESDRVVTRWNLLHWRLRRIVLSGGLNTSVLNGRVVRLLSWCAHVWLNANVSVATFMYLDRLVLLHWLLITFHDKSSITESIIC